MNFKIVQDTETLLGQIKDKLEYQDKVINGLREENAKLKLGIWEKNEIKKLKEEIEFLKGSRNFTITDEEDKEIKNFINTHECTDKKFREISYKFTPYSLGLSGEVICSCGKKFTFSYE